MLFLFFLFEDGGERETSVFVGSIVVSIAVVSFVVVMNSVAFVIFIDVDCAAASFGCVVFFVGEFFLSLRVTWVHPSPLLGWSPVSRFLFSFVDVAAAVLVVVDVFLLVFWGQDRAK